MSGHTHTHTHTYTHTHTHTHTHDNYSNHRCAHARRGLTSGIDNHRQYAVTEEHDYNLAHTISLAQRDASKDAMHAIEVVGEQYLLVKVVMHLFVGLMLVDEHSQAADDL